MAEPMRIGILALQGDVALHQARLAKLSVEAVPVRGADELAACRGLIIPGGESTTFLKLLEAYGLGDPLVAFARERPLWGVCAGSILMAAQVQNPAQRSLAILPITVRRNAYGRQNESFIATFPLRLPGQGALEQEGVFIRAPQVVGWQPEVAVLAEYGGRPVALQYGYHLATTFHPELAEGETMHRHFLALCGGERLAASSA